MKIKLFGILAEQIGSSEIEISGVKNTDELMNFLKEKYPVLQNTTFALAVNKEIANNNQSLNTSDEIALLPPFSGG